jgi:TANFOR domain-containing protein
MSEGQVFPVQSTVQLTPPYSLYLSDYAAPGFERLRVTAFLIDATRPELNVRFRLRIEGNGIKIETKPEFLPPPVTLLGGVPLQLISSDLATYFDPRNLNFTGITQREYEQRGALPEGLYQFCFEVIEYNRGVKISNTGCAVAWLLLNDPPIVNLPRDNEKIRIQDPQQVIFQWTPRHRGSPNSAFNAEYDFKLVEVWPSTRNPNDAILTSPVIFQTTTSETTLIYGPAETPLEPGRRYAFQIRARAYAGADEVSLFKNNGFSQVYTFVYGDACLVPQNIVTSDIGTTRFSVNFDATPNQTNYTLRYRLSPVALAKGDLSSSAKEAPLSSAKATESAWYSTTSLTPNLTINSLQPNTPYEFQVNAGCGTFTSDYSLLTNVTTKDNPGIQYSCGVPLTPFNLDPSQLVNSLKVGDVIKAGDFDVILSKVSGSNGTFSGEGVIEVSYFNRAKVKAEFTNINVSNEMRMVNGYMNVTGAGVEVIPAGVMDLMDNLDEALAQADKALKEYEANLPQQFDENAAVTSTLITVPGTATVTPGSNGSVVIVDGSGKRTEVPAGTTASVVDSSGKGYIIDSKGKVHTTTAAIATAAARREYNLKLKFAAAQDQKFGFDAKRYDPIASTYTKVEDQYLSWKSVATGQMDKVIATLEGSGIDKSKIRFELNGAVVNSQWSSVNGSSSSVTNDQSTNDQKNDQSTIGILGAGDGVESELIALYDAQAPVTNDNSPVTKTQVLGKLSVITYDQIVKDLVIVPVNGNKYPYSEDVLRAQLNKIYGQAVVKWNITFASNFDVPGIDPFDDGGSGLLSNYSPDMRKVVNAYKANLQPNTYYLFLVKNPKSSTLAGFMPRGKECGFIFVDKNGSEEAIVRTIAHELGHGAFTLQHPFADEKYTMKPQGSTNNLMDYTLSGTALYKYQWDRMRYPEIVMGLFEDDDAGKYVLPEAYLISFYNKAAPMLLDEKFKDKIKEIYEFFKNCSNEGWDSYKGEGIVPYCFWRDAQVANEDYYSNADLPFTSGLIDGGYGEAKGLYHLPEAIKELSKYPGKILYAYTLAYWECSPQQLYASWQEYEYVINELAKAEKEGGVWNWVKVRWYEYKDQKEDFEKYFKECRSAQDLRDDVDEIYAFIRDWNEVIKASKSTLEKLNDYWKIVSSTNNIGRYEQGRLVVPTISLVLPFGAGIASKSGKIKDMFKALEKATANDWKKIFSKLEEKIAKGADNIGEYTTKIRWGIQDIEVRPFEKGYWGKRITQKDPRVDAYELKVNPNNESFYLPHPDGGFVQYENIIKATVQDGKLIMDKSSIYHVLDKPEFLTTSSVLEPAIRQTAAAKAAGYKVEWLVSDEKAVQQLTQYFKEKNINITVTLMKE